LWFIINDQNWAFGIGILLLTYSSFSMSNGMFFFLAAAILLLLQKKYKHLFITLMSFSIVVYGYFYGFEASANDEGFAFFKQNPELSFIGFFAHLGASLDFIPSQSLTKRVLICGVSGFLIFITILAWVAKGYSIKINPLTFLQNRFSSKQRLFILGIIIFLFTNAVVLAILRSRFGFNVLIIGNYRLYTSLVLVCAYICFVDLLNIKPQNLLFKGVFCFAILFWIASYAVYLPEVIERRKDLIVRAFNQKYNRIGLGAYHGTFLQKYIADSFRDLPANTPYQYPISDIFSEDDLRKIQSTATAADVLTIELSQETVNGEICLTNLSLKNEIGLNDGLFLILKSETNTYLHYQKRSLKEFIRGYGLFTCLDEKNFKPDDYDLFLLQKTDNTSKLYDMQSRIRIK
ncbi:MAG: hypothetical protein NWP83_03450, partial [Spirosomaceae bacterium]|nr:hypothetical protein [Spirosomataceae bacterium]